MAVVHVDLWSELVDAITITTFGPKVFAKSKNIKLEDAEVNFFFLKEKFLKRTLLSNNLLNPSIMFLILICKPLEL